MKYILILCLTGCANLTEHTITSLQCLGFCSYAEMERKTEKQEAEPRP